MLILSAQLFPLPLASPESLVSGVALFAIRIRHCLIFCISLFSSLTRVCSRLFSPVWCIDSATGIVNVLLLQGYKILGIFYQVELYPLFIICG